MDCLKWLNNKRMSAIVQTILQMKMSDFEITEISLVLKHYE